MGQIRDFLKNEEKHIHSNEYCLCECCGTIEHIDNMVYCVHCNTKHICSNCLINNENLPKYYFEKYSMCFTDDEKSMKEFDKKFKKFHGYSYSYNNYSSGEIIDDGGIKKEHCPICSGNKVKPNEFLLYILDKYQIDENKEIELFKKSPENQ